MVPDLTVKLAGVELGNPLVAAAGTCGYVDELADVLDPAHLGAVVTKSITREPREGHPPWRLVEVPGGMLNAVGLANVGLERFLAEKLPAASAVGTVVIGSIAGNSIDDYREVAAAFDGQAHLPIVELNVSCPNTADGLVFGEDPGRLRELLGEVRPALANTKLLVKLSPNVGDIKAMAEAAIESGADGLTLINTVAAVAIDVESRGYRLSAGAGGGGLSGPAIHPIAVRMVHDVYRSVAKPAGVPLVGLGGVMTWQDAAELILAGATAVGMGTALYVDPRSPKKVLKGLARWVQRQGCAAVSELVGQVR
ncbi:MAG: dihydroorotate dehydrogenase [Planctomycetota bacterium]|jgi:dihydroorotate dehydrogenase (NAD+) catalytic subunit